jgi:hypothetical protein
MCYKYPLNYLDKKKFTQIYILNKHKSFSYNLNPILKNFTLII